MRIGPTFGDELRAAGLNDGVGWNPDTGEIFCPDDKRDAVLAILAAHDPTAKLDVAEEPTLADVVAVLDPQQKSALDMRVAAKEIKNG